MSECYGGKLCPECNPEPLELPVDMNVPDPNKWGGEDVRVIPIPDGVKIETTDDLRKFVKPTDERLRQVLATICGRYSHGADNYVLPSDIKPDEIAMLRKLIEESKFVGLGIVNLDAANTSPYPHKVVANPSFPTHEESK